LCILLSFVLLLLPSLSFAESLNDYLDNIELNLMAILSYCGRLETELQNSNDLSEQQKMQIEQLLSELSELRTRLEVSRTLLERYKSRVGGLLSSIDQLEAKLTQLSASYAASEASWKKTIRAAEKEIRVRRIKTVIWIVAVGVAAGVTGYSIGRSGR
jgi:DNA repair ATPase RecN